MSKDLDYFKEFLENPSAVSLGEFYQMTREWADYIAEHKEDFNYLEDEEWKEIRESLIAEYQEREEEKDLVDARWKIVGKELERGEELDDDYLLRLCNMHIDLAREYKDYFNFTEKMIADIEESVEKFKDSVEKEKISKENLRISEKKLKEATIALDNALMEEEEKTGKKPQLFSFRDIKSNKGH